MIQEWADGCGSALGVTPRRWMNPTCSRKLRIKTVPGLMWDAPMLCSRKPVTALFVVLLAAVGVLTRHLLQPCRSPRETVGIPGYKVKRAAATSQRARGSTNFRLLQLGR